MEVSSGAPATADEKLLSMLRSELIIARELAKSVLGFLTSEKGEADAAKLRSEVDATKREAEALQHDFLSYFSRVAPSLSSREVWMDIFSKVSGIVDKMGGLAYRAEFLALKHRQLLESLGGAIRGMLNSLIAIIDSYMAMMSYVLTSKDKALEAKKKVSEHEKSMDSLYRSTVFAALSMELPASALFLVLNVAEMIEDVADLVNSAADDLYLLTLYSY